MLLKILHPKDSSMCKISTSRFWRYYCCKSLTDLLDIYFSSIVFVSCIETVMSMKTKKISCSRTCRQYFAKAAKVRENLKGKFFFLFPRVASDITYLTMYFFPNIYNLSGWFKFIRGKNTVDNARHASQIMIFLIT